MSEEAYTRDCQGCRRLRLLRMTCELDGRTVRLLDRCHHGPSRWETVCCAAAQHTEGRGEERWVGWSERRRRAGLGARP